MINNLKIQGFKSYFEEQEFVFSVPDGSAGSGLNIITGSNNSGKTSIIDALQKFQSKKIQEEEKNNIPFKITINYDGVVSTLNVANSGHSLVMEGSFDFGKLSLLLSRRHWNSDFSGSNTLDNYDRGSSSRVKSNTDNLGSALDGVDKDNIKRTRYLEILRKLFSSFGDFSIKENRHSTYVEYIENGVKHITDYLGDGVGSIFQLALRFVNQPVIKTIIIDEPELSIQPGGLKKLAKFIFEESANTQIILITHSPYFINRQAIRNGASLFRLKKINSKSKLFKLDSSKDYINMGLYDYQKPYMFDLVANEIFFDDNILFVEGVEDVGLLNKFIIDNNLDINFSLFGYGAGGSGNIKKLIHFADDMGVKCSAIFDGDKSDEYTDCNTAFPSMNISQLPTPDIRDKYKQIFSSSKVEEISGEYLISGRGKTSNQIDKEGIFDSQGNIKEQHRVRLIDKIQDFVQYFGS